MKIVVLDGHTLNPGDNPWDDLARLGELTVHERSAPAEIVERAADGEIVLTNKTPLSADTLAQLPRLRFVAVLATGYNVVDVGAARARNIPVSNVPEYGTDSVAQYVFGLLLELTLAIGEHSQAVRAGEWIDSADFCFWKRPLTELHGLTMGIVGLGRIGRRVAAIAQAFGMNVIASGTPGQSSTDAVERIDRDQLFARADVVSLHCPLTADNEKFVNADLLRRMKPRALLINTARGGLVDEPALAAALNRGEIAGAALDVVASEPMRADNPLRTARHCIITPHIAWASLAARRRLMQATVRNVEAFLAGSPINMVN